MIVMVFVRGQPENGKIPTPEYGSPLGMLPPQELIEIKELFLDAGAWVCSPSNGSAFQKPPEMYASG